jgi:hypothetical protein
MTFYDFITFLPSNKNRDLNRNRYRNRQPRCFAAIPVWPFDSDSERDPDTESMAGHTSATAMDLPISSPAV